MHIGHRLCFVGERAHLRRERQRIGVWLRRYRRTALVALALPVWFGHSEVGAWHDFRRRLRRTPPGPRGSGIRPVVVHATPPDLQPTLHTIGISGKKKQPCRGLQE